MQYTLIYYYHDYNQGQAQDCTTAQCDLAPGGHPNKVFNVKVFEILEDVSF